MLHFTPDVNYRYLDSVSSSYILRISAIFFQKNHVLLLHLFATPVEQILTSTGHHGHQLASGLSLPKAAAANPMAASRCSWSRPRRTSDGTSATSCLQWSILKRPSFCMQHQGSAPPALCSTSSGIRSRTAVLESAEPRWRRSVTSLSRGKCIDCYTIYPASASLFQVTSLVPLHSTKLCHCQTLPNYAINFSKTEPP